jgi:hypothetical protein
MSTPTVPLLASHHLAGPYKTPAMHVEVQAKEFVNIKTVYVR